MSKVNRNDVGIWETGVPIGDFILSLCSLFWWRYEGLWGGGESWESVYLSFISRCSSLPYLDSQGVGFGVGWFVALRWGAKDLRPKAGGGLLGGEEEELPGRGDRHMVYMYCWWTCIFYLGSNCRILWCHRT
jgi:hypothetical protein